VNIYIKERVNTPDKRDWISNSWTPTLSLRPYPIPISWSTPSRSPVIRAGLHILFFGGGGEGERRRNFENKFGQ